MRFATLLAALAVILLPDGSRAQTPRETDPPVSFSAAVLPETVTVGDRFVSHLRARVPVGARVGFGTVASGDSLQPLDSIPAVTSGDTAFAAVYRLVAWRAGEPIRQVVEVTITLPDSTERIYQLALALPVVRSVLPPGDSIEPRLPHGFISAVTAERTRWWLPLLAAVLLAAILAGWLLRRRALPPSTGDAREEALARLAQIGSSIPPLRPDDFYTRVSRVLREYLGRLEPSWSEDLTAGELLSAVSRRSPVAIDGAGLGALLAQAEPVKFGGATPPHDTALRYLERTADWIRENPIAAEPRKEAA